MLETVRSYIESRSLLQLSRDALDVFLVYYLVYRALLVLRGTRAMQIGIGLGVVFLIYVLARVLQLVTVLTIMSALISSMILIIVVVFQSDIRRGLQRVGSRAWFGHLARWQESRVIDEVVDAATDLARHRIGALIAFEQDANLDEFVGVHKGHVVDAQVTAQLLVSLFIPEAVNKLHDGAVIIRNYRIAKAGVFFPMPEGRVADDSFGSRHRAALGITEETDAVVVIVSEERGTISFCFNGNIASNLDGPKLKTMLEAIFSPRVRKKSRKAAAQREAQRESLPESVRTPEPPKSSRLSDPELEHPRISLVADTTDAPAPVRPRSEPPPPLRPPLTGPATSTPNPAAPLRTPVGPRGAPRLDVADGEAPSSDAKTRGDE
ncbi:MAG TPA: diadenylate cyclase CdaA [Polyangiaceae bacterium]|nr:diadenylate cyclase CdaA [Polyangiaceae bacterium]